MENIQVSVRLRPLTSLETTRGENVAWEMDEKHGEIRTMGNAKVMKFPFSKIFGANSTNVQIYNSMVRNIVHSSLEGINGTVFAYGQTSSGKTYTIKGCDSDNGILPLALGHIFNYIRDTSNREFLLRVSYMEVYNEMVHDLLATEEVEERMNLPVHEDKEKGFYVEGLKEIVVTSVDQMFDLLCHGESRRHFGSTDMNEESSRSHVIFRIMMESQECSLEKDSEKIVISNKEKVRVSTLNFVDLGGSERVDQTGAVGDRLKEGKSINKSLLFLGIVISKLAEGETYIPFRDSKLTRILRSSLGGNARTAIICCCSPASSNYEHTLSTLRFGSRALRVKQVAVVNEVDAQKALIRTHRLQIQKLKSRLSTLMPDCCDNVTEDEILAAFDAKSGQLQTQLVEQEVLKAQLEAKLHQLTKLIFVSNANVPVRISKLNIHRRAHSWSHFEKINATTSVDYPVYFESETRDDFHSTLKNGKPRQITSDQDYFYKMEQLKAKNANTMAELERMRVIDQLKEQELKQLKQRNQVLEGNIQQMENIFNGETSHFDEKTLTQIESRLEFAHKTVLKHLHWAQFKNSPLISEPLSFEIAMLPASQQVQVLRTKNSLLNNQVHDTNLVVSNLLSKQKYMEEAMQKASHNMNQINDETAFKINMLQSDLESERMRCIAKANQVETALSEIENLRSLLQKQDLELKTLRSNSTEQVAKVVKLSDENTDPATDLPHQNGPEDAHGTVRSPTKSILPGLPSKSPAVTGSSPVSVKKTNKRLTSKDLLTRTLPAHDSLKSPATVPFKSLPVLEGFSSHSSDSFKFSLKDKVISEVNESEPAADSLQSMFSSVLK